MSVISQGGGWSDPFKVICPFLALALDKASLIARDLCGA